MNFQRFILFLIHAPFGVVVGWSWILLTLITFSSRAPKWEPGWVLTAEWRGWVTKFWKYSTTIGRAIIYQPDIRDDPSEIDSRLERHERKHIWQTEDTMVLSLIIGSIVWLFSGDWLLGTFLYVSGGMWQLPNFLTAGLRQGFTIQGMYRGAEHERSAYAQTDLCRHLGMSWEELDNLRDS